MGSDTEPRDPWFTAWQVFRDALLEAPGATTEEIAAFADELKSRLPGWPPPVESMLLIQQDWLASNPGAPLPPGLFGVPARQLLTVRRTLIV